VILNWSLARGLPFAQDKKFGLHGSLTQTALLLWIFRWLRYNVVWLGLAFQVLKDVIRSRSINGRGKGSFREVAEA